MGKIIKYNVAKDKDSLRVITTVNNSTGGYPTVSGDSTSNSISATLWGNDFHGNEDIDGTIRVNGDIYIDWDDDDIDESEYESEDGDVEMPTGSLYVSGNVEAKSVYGKSIFLDYPEIGNKKTDLLYILKNHDSILSAHETRLDDDEVILGKHETDISKFKNATFWGQGLLTNNYNVVGNMSNVGDINFSGTSKAIGSMSNANVRPNNVYINSNVVVSSYNGNPWEYSLMKNIGAASFLNNNSLQLHSVIDYHGDGNYYNNPRVLWNIYNPKTVQREGHWWLGPNWHNGDINRYGSDGHRNFTLYPSFEVPDNMKDDDGNPKADYFKQFNFNINSNVTAMSFIKHNGKSTEFLMADGSTKTISDLGMATPDDIPSVPTKVSQLENDAKYITKDDIPTKVSAFENDVPYKEYDKYAPVILFSGLLTSANGDSSSRSYMQYYTYQDLCSYHTGVNSISIKYVSNSTPTLQLNLNAKSGWTCKPMSVSATVLEATNYYPHECIGGKYGNSGYWITGGVTPEYNIYLNAWRTSGDDPWLDSIAWKVTKLSVTIFGQCYKN